MKTIFKCLAVCFVFLLCVAIGGAGYFELMPSRKTCVLCHEIQASRANWAMSSHRNVDCKACHGSSVGSLHAIRANAQRIWSHLRKESHDGMRMNEQQVLEMVTRCGTCHQSQFANWIRNGHASPYGKFLQDEKHNAKQKPAEQCLKCHGMFADRAFDDLMTRDGTNTVWRFVSAGQAQRPAVNCLSCHAGHTDPAVATNGVFYYSRADEGWFAANNLMVPHLVTETGRRVRISQHGNTKLCLQCHTPLSSGLSKSGDDRTPTGVHEGLSCTACHNPHSGKTGDSCLQCHPTFSRCGGRDVRQLDTTYRHAASTNDIHHLTCTSCHAEKK
ncbi:MAG: hypothetical protein IJR99_08700 [Kiritimatiellae bacterium]|nr:hypothetical protein [Kiritimatiellia bacterium]